jgi:hypothetical protein
MRADGDLKRRAEAVQLQRALCWFAGLDLVIAEAGAALAQGFDLDFHAELKRLSIQICGVVKYIPVS